MSNKLNNLYSYICIKINNMTRGQRAKKRDFREIITILDQYGLCRLKNNIIDETDKEKFMSRTQLKIIVEKEFVKYKIKNIKIGILMTQL
tara:strand:- start:849 stop:1118 length:270 start_codon:yes stop_codon:yes gene_type:complete